MALVATLAGCGGVAIADERAQNLRQWRVNGPENDGRKYDATLVETRLTLTDGRTVTCIATMHGYGAATDCDWQGAR